MLDHEKYGLEILAVKEIIGYQKAIPVHKTPDYVKGVLNLRGQIIPVIDLSVRFGISEKEHTMYSAIIIATIHGTSLGFIVDEVNEVANVPEENLSNPPEFGSSVDVSYLSKVAQIDKEVIMILDMNRIVDIQDIKTATTGDPAEREKATV
jgi:purine-binding chemotaxis protein CheW